MEQLILQAVAIVSRDEWVQESVGGWRNRICSLDAQANAASLTAVVEAIIALEASGMISIRKFQGSNPISVPYNRLESGKESYRSAYFLRGSFDLRLTHEGRKTLDNTQEAGVAKAGEVPVAPKAFSPEEYDFHPEIERVSARLYRHGHYKQAAFEAYIRVIDEVKARSGIDLDGDKLMNRAFGCEKQTPVIQFNTLKTDAERDEQIGIMFLFKGIVGLRNYKAHSNTLLDDPRRGHDYLALASLLMRLLEIAAVNKAP